jgi:RNA polymerase sigma-70 factor (ECF subfamily)
VVGLCTAEAGSEPELDVEALNDALARLAEFDPEKSQLVELRYFGGLSIEEAAKVLGISPATLSRQWSIARAWLGRKLTEGQT